MEQRLHGEFHHTLHDKPQIGDAVVFNYQPHGGYQGGPKASHVAIVTKLYDDGSIDTVSGDWGGGGDPSQFPGAVDPDQAAFAATATAQVNEHWDPTADSPLGVGPVSGFISPVASDPAQGAGLNLDNVPNLGVRAGQGQLLVAVAHPATLHSGGQPVVTGSNSIFVGPDQSSLAGHGDRTQDGGVIVDRSNDNIYMT